MSLKKLIWGKCIEGIENKRFNIIIFFCLLMRDMYKYTFFRTQTYDIFSNHILKAAFFAFFSMIYPFFFPSLIKRQKKKKPQNNSK
jgi:hypothetical protein